MSSKTDQAVEKFLSGYNCSQSVLFAYAGEVGMDCDTALKVATGLGAGIARCGEMCGALTGGVLAIGLKFGRGSIQDRSATELTYKKAQLLIREFERQQGSAQCRVLVNDCDFTTAEGQQMYKDQDLLHKRCVNCVKTVCEVLEPLLKDSAAKPTV